MKILITGAAGGIGSTLSKFFLKKKYNLILVDNLRNGYIENIEDCKELVDCFHKIDINSSEFEELIKKEIPNVIVHLAAISSLPDCEVNFKDCLDINVKGTANVLHLSSKYGVDKVIFGSTSAVYENNKMGNLGFSETDLIEPKLYYSLSKKMAEELCQTYEKNYNLNVIILRFFNVFGPNQDLHRKNPPVLNYLVREYLNDRTPILHSNGNQMRDYIYVDDVVKIIETVIKKNNFEKKIINVCSGKLISLKSIVDIVRKTLDVKNLNEVYRSSEKLWDEHPTLFEGVKPLLKDVVNKETNKKSLGNTKTLKDVLGYFPSENIEELISNVVMEISKVYFQKKT